MNANITAWLEPLFDAAEHTDINLWELMQQATKPLTKVQDSDLPERLGGWPDVPDLSLALDWVKFGQLLRHELDWEARYPAQPSGRGHPVRRPRTNASS